MRSTLLPPRIASLPFVLGLTLSGACGGESPHTDPGGGGTSAGGGGGSAASTSSAGSDATTASTSSTGSAGAGGSGAGGSVTVGGERPAEVFVPSSYDGSKPLPLVVLLHGYTASGAQQEAYFKIRPHAESRGFLYVAPDGTKSPNGPRFWNATDACCDYSGTEVDDAAYLRALVDEAREKLHVDDKRIYFIGHSNGGFMSHRMACEHADRVAAIASFAGALWKDEAKCNPSEPVAVLQAHGTNDAIVSYEGGSTAILGGAEYPGAEETTLDWAAKNGCSPSPDDSQPNLDLVTSVPGAETERVAFTGCKAGGRAELWSLQNAGHVPSLSEDFIPSILDFLFAHPKP